MDEVVSDNLHKTHQLFFSKSFGYALRAILYIAIKDDGGKRVKIEEIAEHLAVPRHFLGKILKRLAGRRILASTKGPYGGFALHEGTMKTTLKQLVEAVDGKLQNEGCVLYFRPCNDANPCPLHHLVQPVRTRLIEILRTTNLSDLKTGDNSLLLSQIAADTDWAELNGKRIIPFD